MLNLNFYISELGRNVSIWVDYKIDPEETPERFGTRIDGKVEISRIEDGDGYNLSELINDVEHEELELLIFEKDREL